MVARLARCLPLVALLFAACGEEAPSETAPSREDHDRYFPIEQGMHEGITCNECHGKFDTFRHFTCIDCHAHTAAETNPIHQGIAGYAWGDETCYPCHPRGEAEGAGIAHEVIFPIAPDTAHGEVSCMECHETRSDRSKLLCASCHSDAVEAPKHAAVEDYAAVSSSCVRCHADSQIDAIAAHAPFKIQSGSPHAAEACLACHEATRADKAFGADWSQQSCTGSCHTQPATDPTHAGMADYAYTTPKCLDCHPSGTAAGVDHEPIFPLAAPAAHRGIACAECHADATTRKNVTCQGACHADAAGDHAPADVPDFTLESSGCARCHADSQVDPVAAHAGFRIDAQSPHAVSACLECHPAMRADKAFGADFGVKDCLSGCHGAGHEEAETTRDHQAEGVGEFEWSTDACLLCHPDGQSAINVNHVPIFPIGAGSTHAAEGVTCAKCHASTTNREQVLCAECHATEGVGVARDHANVAGFAASSPTCLRCHADSQVDPVASHGSPVFIITNRQHKQACWNCHTSDRADRAPYYEAVDFTPFDCFGGCHEHSRNGLAGKHAEEGVAGFSTMPSTGCLQQGCHHDGRNHD